MPRDRNDQDRKLPCPKRLRPNRPDRNNQIEVLFRYNTEFW